MKNNIVWKLLAAVMAFVFPPLAVLMMGCSAGTLILNVILTFLLMWVPGVIHALYKIFEEDKS